MKSGVKKESPWSPFVKVVHCPKCAGPLALLTPSPQAPLPHLKCEKCASLYPILQDIPILLRKPQDYILEHAKGIGRFVSSEEIPKAIRRDFESIVRESQSQDFLEDDLESKRVIALYTATHYLSANGGTPWWRKPESTVTGSSAFSPAIEKLMRDVWDHGLWSEVRNFATRCLKNHRGGPLSIVELGCGVGGVARFFDHPSLFYLGLDTSFASLQIARKFYQQSSANHAEFKFRLPGDLLQGEFEREARVTMPVLQSRPFFCVSDIENAPLRPRSFDGNISLNTIDMLDRPEALPQSQKQSVVAGGWIMGASPMIWQPKVAQGLRKKFSAKSSGELFRQLYEAAEITLTESKPHLPWLFFKHERQVELYSVDYLVGKVR